MTRSTRIMAWALANAAGFTIGLLVFGFLPSMFPGDWNPWSMLMSLIVGPAVLGGCMGIAQSLIVRQWDMPAIPWFWVTASAWTIVMIGYGPWFYTLGTVVGFAAGILQWLILQRRAPHTIWWIPVSAMSWAAGWAISRELFRITYMDLALSIGGILAGTISGLALSWMLEPRRQRTDISTGLVVRKVEGSTQSKLALICDRIARLAIVLVLGVGLFGMVWIGYGFLQGPLITIQYTIDPAQATTVPVITRTRSADGMVMVQVPGGIFHMGRDAEDAWDEIPVHEVTLDDFWIDQTEVTNAQYARCVAAKVCSGPYKSTSATRSTYYEDREYDDYPVIYVGWDDANRYCAWADAQLPSEAQWEYTAKGPDSREYPWGYAPPNASLLNYNNNVGDTTKVGSFPVGASWVGVLDMAGNVYEWVCDWYGPYSSASQENPIGPKYGTYRVLRGGAFSTTDENSFRTADREASEIDRRLGGIGFRCASAVPGK
jgi:formylglycine-generating enzyme required for sulfatase activity